MTKMKQVPWAKQILGARVERDCEKSGRTEGPEFESIGRKSCLQSLTLTFLSWQKCSPLSLLRTTSSTWIGKGKTHQGQARLEPSLFLSRVWNPRRWRLKKYESLFSSLCERKSEKKLKSCNSLGLQDGLFQLHGHLRRLNGERMAFEIWLSLQKEGERNQGPVH